MVYSMKEIKFFLLLAIGFLLIGIGFFIGRSSNKTESISEKSIIPSITTSITQNKKGSVLGKAEVLVTKVFDGDTIEINYKEKIRYIGINAPEKGQPFSSKSLLKNQELVSGKKVRLELDVQTKDRYRRTLAYVFIGDIFVNQEMVKEGLAVSETIQPNVKYQKEILEAQKRARESCIGVWQGLCDKGINEVLGEKSSKCIVIVSINADAKGNDNQNKNGEWIEIKNSCFMSISLDGWLLKDESASNKYMFKHFSLEANGTVFLYSGCGEDSKDKVYWQCPEGKYAIWNNSGDHAFLYNERGQLVADYQY